jgi:hypothetical protein
MTVAARKFLSRFYMPQPDYRVGASASSREYPPIGREGQTGRTEFQGRKALQFFPGGQIPEVYTVILAIDSGELLVGGNGSYPVALG